MHPDLKILAEKIDFLQKHYGYTVRFKKKAQEKELIKFEKKFQVQLPEDYREFILRFGNGGEFGLSYFDFNHYVFHVDPNDRISSPFPLTEAHIYTEENPVEFDRSFFNGQITIESGGCGNYTFLVIKGSEHGNVWWHEWPSNCEILPFTGFDWEKRHQVNVRKNFCQWYADVMDLELKRWGARKG